MIPKIIHYCWFGNNEKDKLAIKCIESWKKFCPDYEIIEWNETNFDVHINEYTSYCYENKKWAFLSDYIRLYVIKKYGGIYLDTDVELINSYDSLLTNEAFFGFETLKYINTGHGFGAIPNHPIVSEMLNIYDALRPGDDGSYTLSACPELNTRPLLKKGLKQDGTMQIIDKVLILPIDFLNPFDDPTGTLKKTDNTISIHWYNKSWINIKAKRRSKVTRIFHRIFGVDCFAFLKRK